jgi:hypothetical protein
MQRSPTIWQDRPNVFVPERWTGLEEGHDQGYMPFGASPFNCPAKRYKNVPMPFGPAMIALLVGTLIHVTGAKGYVLTNLQRGDCPLDTDREAYSTVVLRRCYGWEDYVSQKEAI